jgi:hypothetical protein
LAELFNRWTGRKQEGGAGGAGSAPLAAESTTTSKVFPRFMAALTPRPSPVLLDLGPVVGANISFLGDRLACKIYVEDLFAELEAIARRGADVDLGAALVDRLHHGDEAIDGILCWDLFDFLDKRAGKAVAARLVKMLRKGGAVHGFFGTTPVDLTHYTRFMVDSEDTVRLRPYPATKVKRTVLLTREINIMFAGLQVSESVLLKTSTRETLFRKP